MPYVQVFFNREAAFTPSNARLVAVKAYPLWYDLAAARAALLSIE
jgi:hypothetical protein